MVPFIGINLKDSLTQERRVMLPYIFCMESVDTQGSTTIRLIFRLHINMFSFNLQMAQAWHLPWYSKHQNQYGSQVALDSHLNKQ